MKMLIVINNLLCGGAQKSLISLLNRWEQDKSVSIDLLVLNQANLFFDNVPEWVTILPQTNEVNMMYLTLKQVMKKKIGVGLKIKSIISKLLMKFESHDEYNEVQKIWKAWKSNIPMLNETYDLAVSYVDGFSNYYVIDKVKAKRKILWVHNEYDKLTYSSEYDAFYFAQANQIVTISDVCGESLKQNFPELQSKIRVIPNLSPSEMIEQMAGDMCPEEYKGKGNILISIGRLNEQKGFDFAIEAAKLMKQKGGRFCWFIIGEGELREQLQNQIKRNNVEEQVYLLGTKKNPYPYIKFADIFVQPSRYEGKSIVLDEAKILGKPIVITNYPSAKDSIINKQNGLIAEINADAIAETVLELLKDEVMQERFKKELRANRRNEETEFWLYKKLFLENS